MQTNFAIGVWAGSYYVRAGLVSSNGTVRRYQVAVPKAATVRLHLDTRLNVVGAGGSALATRVPSTTISAAGRPDVFTNLIVP